eukprot:scaffold8290_cov38-Cyclotella_meneghiniana.AAC.2
MMSLATRKPVGTETCGEVRRAIHHHSGNERAVKIIKISHRHCGISDPLINKAAQMKPAAASDEEDTANLTDEPSSEVDSLTSKEPVSAKLEEGSVSTKSTTQVPI